ncbi:ABC transporter substrate-binding protein [Achromobacter sp. RTa]|uniref:tripartite tricarboxylate transporter substrate-binding protein n=1 Tax=Achromobacter sp. RTa TaxID=1532557 RepID=UPI00050F5177|nr:tripartite tricarboxylate transporter substrate-binding protein [Achromobacter sp. RTa]KGD97180.1 ABC transporter substrate-binding protein [Achromobacter sp. RTa]
MKALKETLLFLAGAALCGAASAARPDVPKQVKIVVPFTAGASNDAIARAIAPQLAARLGSTVIVENRSGAAGAIGSEYVARSAKDGSVLLLTSSTFLTTAATQPHLPYDPLKQFAPVAMIGQGPLVIATSAQTPYGSLQELLDAARKRPGVLNYGSAGVGSLAHLATVMLDDAAGTKMTHVPYKGAANAASDLAGGLIDVMLSNYSTLAPVVQGKKVKLLATTADSPQPAFPGLPPAAQTLPGYAVQIWVGVFAPAGTPQPYIEKLNAALNEISASPEMAALLDIDGTVPARMGSAEFGARVRDELSLWQGIARKHGISSE